MHGGLGAGLGPRLLVALGAKNWCVWIISTFTWKKDVVSREVRQKWCRMVVSKWPGKIYVPRSTVTCTIKNVEKWWKVTKNENFYFRLNWLRTSSYSSFNAFWIVFRSETWQNISFQFLAKNAKREENFDQYNAMPPYFFNFCRLVRLLNDSRMILENASMRKKNDWSYDEDFFEKNGKEENRHFFENKIRKKLRKNEIH